MKTLAEIASRHKEPARFASEVAQAFELHGGILVVMGELKRLQEEVKTMELAKDREEADSKLSEAAITSMKGLIGHKIGEKEVRLLFIKDEDVLGVLRNKK